MRRAIPLTLPSPIMHAVASAILVMAVLLVLSACATQTPVIDIQTVCPPIVTYSAADQANLKAAYDALPAGSILRRVVMDYEALRDSVRACKAESAASP